MPLFPRVFALISKPTSMSSKTYESRIPEEDEESLTETLAESVSDEKREWKRMSLYEERPRSWFKSVKQNWQWLAHGVLLSMSLVSLVQAYRIRHADRDVFFTKKYSSYCESYKRFIGPAPLLTTRSSCRRSRQLPHGAVQPHTRHGLVSLCRIRQRGRPGVGSHYQQWYATSIPFRVALCC